MLAVSVHPTPVKWRSTASPHATDCGNASAAGVMRTEVVATADPPTEASRRCIPPTSLGIFVGISNDPSLPAVTVPKSMPRSSQPWPATRLPTIRYQVNDTTAPGSNPPPDTTSGVPTGPDPTSDLIHPPSPAGVNPLRAAGAGVCTSNDAGRTGAPS